MNELLMLGTIPAVTTIVQGVKSGIGLDGRWAFLSSIVTGVATMALVQGYRASVDAAFAINWFGVVLEGVIAGLSASGLYAGLTTNRGGVGHPADPTEDIIRND